MWGYMVTFRSQKVSANKKRLENTALVPPESLLHQSSCVEAAICQQYSSGGSNIRFLIHDRQIRMDVGSVEHVAADVRAGTTRDPTCMPINIIM